MIHEKLIDEISSIFSEFFIIGEYVEIRFKNRGHHAIFSVLEIKRSKKLQKFNKRDYSCLHFWFHFHGVSRAKTDLLNEYMI